MDKILDKIIKLMENNMHLYLEEVKNEDLEENGEIYYMNGNDGTEFDWYVNKRLPEFMMFYNDEKNLGAVKLNLYNDGTVIIYLYGEHGEKLNKEVKTYIECTKKELIQFAVLLKNETDEKCIWNSSIRKISSNIEVSNEQVQLFLDNKKDYEKFELYKMEE